MVIGDVIIRQRLMFLGRAQGCAVGTPRAGDASSAELLTSAADVLEAQTSRGLIVVSALLKIAARLVAPALLADAGEEAAAELGALHAELKEHTNSVLDAMWHMRNLPKAWK